MTKNPAVSFSELLGWIQGEVTLDSLADTLGYTPGTLRTLLTDAGYCDYSGYATPLATPTAVCFIITVHMIRHFARLVRSIPRNQHKR